MILSCTFCQSVLSFRILPGSITWHCTCPTCRKRADAGDGDGHTIAVDGYGVSRDAAEENWRSRVNTF